MIAVWGPGQGAPGLVANAYLEGTYAETYPDAAHDLDGMARLFRQFSFPGGIPSHASPEAARLDPRGRGARLFPGACLRRRPRQPRSDGRLRGRRRRGRGRPAGGRLARKQVPQPTSRRHGPAHPASQRLQDRQPDGPRLHAPGGVAQPARRLRLRTDLRGRRRAGHDAPGHGGRDRRCLRRHRGDPGTGEMRRGRATALGCGRAAQSEVGTGASIYDPFPGRGEDIRVIRSLPSSPDRRGQL